MSLSILFQKKIGKKVLVRKKSSPNYTIVGVLSEIIGTKAVIKGNVDTYVIDFDDILSLDIKGKESFEER